MNEASVDVTSNGNEFSDYEVSEVTAKQVDTVEVSTEGAKTVHCKQTKKLKKKKTTKHVKRDNFDEDLGPDTHYAVLNLKMKDGTSVHLKGKGDTRAQVNLMNAATFKKIFGDNSSLLHSSNVFLHLHSHLFKDHSNTLGESFASPYKCGSKRCDLYLTEIIRLR